MRDCASQSPRIQNLRRVARQSYKPLKTRFVVANEPKSFVQTPGNGDASARLEEVPWLNRDVLLISLSAFFSDLGYQGVIVILPILLVVSLNQSVVTVGVITGVSYGVGSLFAFVGGKAGDRYGRKRVSIIGNAFIPLLSLSGLPTSAFGVGSLFTLGWWSRNFRTPSRRALLVDNASGRKISKAFGFLHALDVAGGMLAVIVAASLVLVGVRLGDIILLSAAPITVATILLFFVRERPALPGVQAAREVRQPADRQRPGSTSLLYYLLISSALFGLSSYSFSFPILTVALSAHSIILGVATYGVFLGASSISGYAFGNSGFGQVSTLGIFGYLLGGVASLAIGAVYAASLGVPSFYVATALLGIATGVTETFEPTLVSSLVKSAQLSGGMGYLTAARSAGLFISNVVVGLLFTVSQPASYAFAGTMSLVAGAVILFGARTISTNPRP